MGAFASDISLSSTSTIMMGWLYGINQSMSEQLLEEIEVLHSIFTIESVCHEVLADGSQEVVYRDEERGLALRFHLPSLYPSQDMELVQITAHSLASSSRSIPCKLLQERAMQHLNELAGEGEVVMFQVIECVKELYDQLDNTSSNAIDTIDNDEVEQEKETYEAIDYHSLGDAHELSHLVDCHLNIIHGPVSVEQRSSFQSHIATVASMDDVHVFRRKVYEDKKVARATHNIFAYRFTCKKTGIVYHDNDDDGETAAGARLAEMMRLMGVDGVAVIVSRWFGGILLGPDRFKCICNSARFLLEEQGFGDVQKKGSRRK